MNLLGSKISNRRNSFIKGATNYFIRNAFSIQQFQGLFRHGCFSVSPRFQRNILEEQQSQPVVFGRVVFESDQHHDAGG